MLGIPNSHSKKIKLKALNPHSYYQLEETGEIFSGELLVSAGFLIKGMWGDYQSKLYHFIEVDKFS